MATLQHMLKGILFDMDGVLVDSEEYICQAAIQMFSENGLIVQPDDFLPFVGAGEDRYLGGVAEKYGFKHDIEQIKARTYAIYEQITHGKLAPLTGVKQFIASCRDKGLKLAIATSADKIKMEINLREIGFPPEYFDALVNGLDIERKKPFPDIYLKAAELLGLKPEECLVVEDAINGVEAAKKAGAKCLALTTSFSEGKLRDADWIAPHLGSVPRGALEW